MIYGDKAIILCRLLILIEMRFVFFNCWDETESERNGLFNEYLLALSSDASIFFLAYYRQDKVTHIYCFIICLAISIFRWMKTKPYKISVNAENSLNVWMTLFKVTHLRLLIVIWLWKWILIINTCCDSWVQFVAKQEIFLFLNGKHTLHNRWQILAGNAPCKVNLNKI